MAQDKRGISAAKLARDIEVSPPTAWLMLQKIRKAMADRDASYLLSQIVEIDDAYFGAPDEGGKRGRGTDKTPGVIAVQVDALGRPEYVKLIVVENLRKRDAGRSNAESCPARYGGKDGRVQGLSSAFGTRLHRCFQEI